MRSATCLYLKQIIEQCDMITEAVNKFGSDRAAFENDVVFRNAVAFPFIEIRKTIGNVDPLFMSCTDDRFHWRDFIRMGNKCTHDYSSVDINTLWNMAVNDIPNLRKECVSSIERNDKLRKELKEEQEDDAFAPAKRAQKIYSIDEIRAAVAPVAKTKSLKSVYLFGSYARGEADEESDVDLLIETEDQVGLLDVIGLEHDFKDALQTDVDVIHSSGLKKRVSEKRTFSDTLREEFIDNVNREKVLLYGTV